MKHLYKNNSGFSLVEIMIAGAIMGVIILGTTQMLQGQMQTVSFLEDKLSGLDFKGTLIGKLNNEDACKETLGGLAVSNSQNLTAIKAADGSVTYSTTDTSLSSFNKLDITRIQLQNVNLVNAANQFGEMKILVSLKRQRLGGGPPELKPLEITLGVRTRNTTALIDSCRAYSDGGFENQTCANHPPGITGPPKIYNEGSVIASGDENYLCINSKWTSIGLTNPSGVTPTTSPPVGCTRGVIWNGFSWVCMKDGR